MSNVYSLNRAIRRKEQRVFIDLLDSMVENFKENPVLMAVLAVYGVLYIAGIVITPIRDVIGLDAVRWMLFGAGGAVILIVVLFVLSLFFGDG